MSEIARQSGSGLKFNTISFLSDLGTGDEMVGVIKSVIRSISADITVLDISHGIDAHDIRAAGLALARSAQYLVPGVVLGVVDPGVGTDRKPIAIEVGDGQSFLVGPDNGLFAPAVSMVGGATGAAVLDNPDFHLPTPGLNFAGRDIYAPVAAQLCLGVPLDELGTMIDPAQLQPGVLPVSTETDDGSMQTEVLWIDRYGNVQLNVDPDSLADWPKGIRISGDNVERSCLRVTCFAEIPTGGIGVLTDSYGLLAVAVDRGSAAAELGLNEGDGITLYPTDMARTSSPVVLKPSRTQPVENPQ